ncbi:MAG: hypothetical protein JWL77_3514 [Chthonomonadaceae bacterium]|nr:hypothetical protein [Chthonomonadaceae bacterium]
MSLRFFYRERTQPKRGYFPAPIETCSKENRRDGRQAEGDRSFGKSAAHEDS